MKSTEIRAKFLSFFEKRGHAIIPSASLVPENDPSVLFNTAGMQPLVPYLLGAPHPLGRRLANFQKCVRTGDIEDIGDNTHATFFEMMGNWSLGDYFKKDTIEWSFELLTSKEEGFGLDPLRLYVTCFAGDENAPRDEESAQIWKDVFAKHGITGNRIYFLPAKNNWWSPGDNGPCGPDTEMFYDVSGLHARAEGLTHEEFLAADEKQELVEIWNDVFMEYQKKDGVVVGKLSAQNVDTGSGFERVTMVLQGVNNIFDTDIFQGIIQEINASRPEETVQSSSVASANPADIRAVRVIADHIRTSVFLIADGVLPANSDQGYILRRLIRRAVRFADVLQLKPKALFRIADAVCETYKDVYENIGKQRETIKVTIEKEEQKFRNTLNRGLKELNSILATTGKMSSENAFLLYESYGFPVELTKEICTEKGITIDMSGFNEALRKHQEMSRAGASQKFKGGMGDTSEISIKYHTTTHLLHQALREVLGTHVSQKGSNITAERLRFDFAHTAKMTDDEKKRVEDIVNQKINDELPVHVVTLTKEEAEQTGALHFFGDKYGDTVTVYYIGDALETAYSKEFCGGPHVQNTRELRVSDSARPFSIQKEEAVAQGVRRIKAVLS
jgi:alanyl-tRNA synthetase